MASMFATIRKKLPGRKASIFWATVLGTTGFYQYNKHESKKRLDYYCKRAEMVANETIGALDTPRKVHVYVAIPMGELGTRKARLHWERYILPVFVAGALDYELTLVNDTVIDSDGAGSERVVRGGVHSLVAEEIKERRRKALEEDSEELKLWRTAIEERKKENEERVRRNKAGAFGGGGAQELDISNWKPEPYPGTMDIVAIGRETWTEVVNGISDGALGSLNCTIPPLVLLDSEEQERKNNAAERKISTDANSAMESASPGSPHDEGDADKTELQITDTVGVAVAAAEPETEAPAPPPVTVDYDRYTNDASSRAAISGKVPAVAYISHMNITGWSNVPLRVWNFFHDQQNVDLYAQQALQIVFESTKRAARGVEELADMGKAEEELAGWEGQERIDVVIDPAVAECLQIYDTQNDTAPRFPDETRD
ncbi:mitochondrial import inner membrane translocase subunit tim54 [Coemansia sp. RSA 1933]|nr:mitochondrial import inner membrane translocase subunit tim54 [Coemansia sp. RSA 1933]